MDQKGDAVEEWKVVTAPTTVTAVGRSTKKVQRNKTMLITTNSNNSSSIDNDNDNANDNKGNTTTSIMFVELGRGLTRGQIRFLSTVVTKKGLQVVHTLDRKPTFMVVDPFVNVETLAQYLKFKGTNITSKVEQLKHVISKYNITPVKPTWITNNRGTTFRSPKLTELYNGLILTKHPCKQNQQHGTISTNSSNNQIQSRQLTGTPDPDSKSQDWNDKNKKNLVKKLRNAEIAGIFRKLATIYQKAITEPMDEFRAYTFHLVAGRLEQLDFEIQEHDSTTVMTKLGNISGFGASTLRIIKEWIQTRRLERIQLLETDEQRLAIRNLIRIWGVGPKTAQHLYNTNFRTIDEVREGLRTNTIDYFNDNQKIGVDCYEDFQLHMTRQEVERINSIVQTELHSMLPNASISVMGSYRRGKAECGDADLFITDPGYINCTPRLALGQLVRRLMNKQLIAFNLTQITGLKKEDGDDIKADEYEPYPSSQSYMGVFYSPTIPGVRRRIDIKFYPFRERAFASLYFTGCGWFNRSMRLWATRKKNLHLNDHGLFPEDGKGQHVPKPNEALLHEASSEEDVFRILSLVYKQPQERKCFDDVVSIDGLTVSSLNLDDKTIWQAEKTRTNSAVYTFVNDDD